MAEANDRQAKQQEIVEPVKHALEDALAEVDSPQMNTIFLFLHVRLYRRRGLVCVDGAGLPARQAGRAEAHSWHCTAADHCRRQPFISIIQAIVIGRKPGSWSFPSGHSAVAFAGAWLFSQHMPRRTGLFYLIASLVGFSRIYLGSHYPGDVAAGSLLGTLFAMLARWLMLAIRK